MGVREQVCWEVDGPWRTGGKDTSWLGTCLLGAVGWMDGAVPQFPLPVVTARCRQAMERGRDGSTGLERGNQHP